MDKPKPCEQDPYDRFNVKNYIKEKYAIVTAWNAGSLKLLHDFYSSINTTGLKILEIGSGPVPIYQCSAVPYASEIVFSDYAKPNLIALQKWVDKDPTAFDFTPLFEYVVQELEGKEKSEAAKRQDDLRQLVKGVIFCDMTKDQYVGLPEGYEGPYDIIFSSLATPCACSTIEDYNKVIQRLTSCLKIGGKLILITPEAVQSCVGIVYKYKAGNETFCGLGVNAELHNIALSEAGYRDTVVTYSAHTDTPGAMEALPAVVGTIFSISTKASN